MKKISVLILIGYGINCDYETRDGFSLGEKVFPVGGVEAKRVHINDLIAGRESLAGFQILVFPGGFSYGDDIASGKVLANKIKINLREKIRKFVEEGKLVLGICNGFQALVKAGLLPGFDGDYGAQRATLTFNDSGRFEDRWIYLENENDKCVFTRGMEGIYLPVAHGEGKFFAEEDVLKKLEDSNQIVFRYADGEGNTAGGRFPYNPNGSLGDIAGICDPTGRIFGLMPHPERYLYFTNHPRWTREKEKLKRQGVSPPEHGEGLQIFKNALRYVKENL
ncbi:phosphoribosylformylglycinamidine synthase I [candidate division NPL-UPA2 bacterium]|nr:phosphoribosylformylglycinamidine synthase I [candidate division NPL-UPA2 bacterium]